MAKWVHQNVLDNGLNFIKNNATKMLLVKAYTAGDPYATIIANKVAEANMTPADFGLGSSGINRLLTTATKSTTALTDATGSPDLHFVFTNGVDTPIWGTDETSNVAVANGGTVNFPALTYTAYQPS